MLVLYIKIVMVLRPLDIMVFKARKFVIIRRAGGGAWGTAHTPRDFLWGAVPPFFGRGLPPPINTLLSPLKIKCALRHNAKYYCPNAHSEAEADVYTVHSFFSGWGGREREKDLK